MKFSLRFTPTSEEDLRILKNSLNLAKRYNAVTKALRFLESNPHHPSLQTHPYYSLIGPHGEKVFEAYAEQDTPAAYRIFFYYSTQKRGEIVVFAITPHP